MSTELVQEAPVYQCRHIFTDGRRCGSRSLRGEYFCYYHHQTRRPVENLGAHSPREDRRGQQSTFTLPLPEDRSAIQAAIGQVIQRIALNEIDPRRAGLLLYALQIASSNLPKTAKGAEPVETVDEITLDEHYGPIAPESQIHKAPGEKSLETILMEQWNETDEPATVDIEASEAGRVPHPHDSLTVVRVGLVCGSRRPLPRRTKSKPKSRLNPPALNTLDTLRGEG